MGLDGHSQLVPPGEDAVSAGQHGGGCGQPALVLGAGVEIEGHQVLRV